MSSSSSKPPSAPPINPQLQLESALTIPPDPGNSFQGSTESSNSHTNPNPPHQNANQTLITFSHVLQYYWRGNHNIIASPTPPQIWLAQNVYPLVTPMRMICFSMSQISFMLAYGFFMETEFYKTHVVGDGGGGHHHHVHAPPLVFSLFVANVVHFVFLVFLQFFSFFTAAYERYLHHDILKSLGELGVMAVMSLPISSIGHKQHQEGDHDEVVALLATCVFLTIDSLCIIILLKPGHHYSMLDATLTLTLHLGLEGKGGIYAIPATLFVFVILAIKNFLWRCTGHA